MIGWLQGQLADRWQQASRCGLLLVCGGVGYEVQMPRRQWDRLGEAGSALSLHIHQVIREDAWTLYGFASRAERDLFRELVAVSGVGPQMALGLLGQLSCEELVRAIVQADLRLLTQAPGVGKRTAERLAVELRTRLTHHHQVRHRSARCFEQFQRQRLRVIGIEGLGLAALPAARNLLARQHDAQRRLLVAEAVRATEIAPPDFEQA